MSSGRPLAERLQVKGSRRIAVLNAGPAQEVEVGIADRRAPLDTAEVVLAFFKDRSTLEAELLPMKRLARGDAILWLAYPKLSSSLAADLSRDVIHALVPSHGLATVASVAIDEDWTALRVKPI